MKIMISILTGIFLWLGSIIIEIPFYYIEFLSISILVILLIFIKKVIIDKNLIILITLVLLNILSTTINSYNSFQGVKVYLMCTIIYETYLLLLFNEDLKHVENFFWTYNLIFFILSMFSIIKIVLINNLWSVVTIYRYKSFFQLGYGQSNYIAALFVFSGILSFNYFFISQVNKFFKSSLVLLSIMCGIIILILNSRTSIIVYIVFLFFILLKNLFINKKISLTKKIIILIFFTLIFFIIFKLPFFNLMKQRFDTEINNFNDRIIQYEQVIDIIKNGNVLHILFGYGFGTEKQFFDVIIHNIILKVMYSNGLLGVLVYGYYLFQFFKKTENKLYNSIKNAILSIIVISLVEPVIYTAFVDYYLVIILAIQTIILKNDLFSKRHVIDHVN